MQRTSDQEILPALGHGERKFGWDEWFGDVDGTDYLTDRGKQAARQAIADLTQFFGDGWLSRPSSTCANCRHCARTWTI